MKGIKEIRGKPEKIKLNNKTQYTQSTQRVSCKRRLETSSSSADSSLNISTENEKKTTGKTSPSSSITALLASHKIDEMEEGEITSD